MSSLTETIVWHSVDELLPDDQLLVLCFCPGSANEPVVAAFHSGSEWNDHEGFGLTDNVTHWAEIPTGPFDSKTQSRFPLKKRDTFGMRYSLSGVLGRAAECLGKSRDYKHLKFPISELVQHIECLRESESDSQALERLEQFLNLWVSA